jgi:hypothetical protein
MSYYAKRFEIKRFLFFVFLFSCSYNLVAQSEADENVLKAYLQYSKCNFDKGDIVVLSDENTLRFSNNFELELQRTVYLKFLKPAVLNESLSEVLFYHDKTLKSIELTKALVYYQDPQLLISFKDISQKLATNVKVSFDKGQVLQVSYTAKCFYTRKMPAVRVQHTVPTEKFSYHFSYPELVTLDFQMPDALTPDVNSQLAGKGSFRVNGVDQNIAFTEKQITYIQVPSLRQQTFTPSLFNYAPQIAFHITGLKRFPAQEKAEKIQGDFGQSVVEQVLKRKDVMPRLLTRFDVPKAYDYRINAIPTQEEKLGRIFDLVRRNFRWNKVDSLFIDNKKTFESLWTERKCTGSEINLTLVKVLMNYGFEAYPMLVSTRSHGRVEQEFAEIEDFNRMIAVVYFHDKVIPLDATQTFGDYPILSTDVLNTWGLSVAMSPERWVYLEDTTNQYHNSTLLLGTLLNDGVYRTNAYVNSFSYAKALRVASLEKDSVKNFIKTTFRSPYPVKHFIVVNEYVDSLPLAQEFDIEIPVIKDNDLREVNVNFGQFPDTLKMIEENRTTPLDFGFLQNYELKGEFSFPQEYQIYLLPSQTSLSILNGDVSYSRTYHGTSQAFSYVSTLVFRKSFFNVAESREIGTFMKKIANYQLQNVIVRKVE